MSRSYGVQVALALIFALGTATPVLSQCNNQISLVPLRTLKAASNPRDFVRFSYSLSASEALLVRSHEDTGTSIGPYDTGFVITPRREDTAKHCSGETARVSTRGFFFCGGFHYAYCDPRLWERGSNIFRYDAIHGRHDQPGPALHTSSFRTGIRSLHPPDDFRWRSRGLQGRPASYKDVEQFT